MWPKQQERKLKRSNNTDVTKTTTQKTEKEQQNGCIQNILLGEEELNNNQVAIKPLTGQGEQEALPIPYAISYL
jgi:histidyl-tRNA synthetase